MRRHEYEYEFKREYEFKFVLPYPLWVCATTGLAIVLLIVQLVLRFA